MVNVDLQKLTPKDTAIPHWQTNSWWVGYSLEKKSNIC